MILNTPFIEIRIAELKITKATLANRSGISRQNISKILQRGTCEPRTAGKLACGLNLCVNEIVKSE